MPVAIIALVAFIATIIIWNVGLKRNMGEAMGLGLVVTALFAGADAPRALVNGLLGALDYDVLYAALAFIFMAYIVEVTGLIEKILEILNVALGRLRGGPAYVSTAASAVFGALSGSNSANTAASGTFTGPWMIRSGWTRERAATILAGNGGLGAAIPPSASMVIMLGFAGDLVTTSQVYLGLLTAGAYQIVHRVVLIRYFVARDDIPATAHDGPDLLSALRNGLGAMSIFLGAAIPVLVTVGPLADFLRTATPLQESLDDVSLLIWIPVCITCIALVVGWRQLPHTVKGWNDLVDASAPRFATVGALLLFAIAASEILGGLGLAADVRQVIQSVPLQPWALVMIVGLLITIVAGPLSSTATLTAVGNVSLLALVGAGLDPLVAIIAILVFASTEGASPPASGAIFVAAGLTGARPESTFGPLIIYYMLPVFLIGCLIGWGIIPIAGH